VRRAPGLGNSRTAPAGAPRGQCSSHQSVVAQPPASASATNRQNPVGVAYALRVLDLLAANLRTLGVFAILLCVGTWALDLAEWVHPCVYCRTQRTAIGLVGVVMLLPNPRIWWARYPAAVFCFFGAHVAVSQLFMIVKSINGGEPFGALNLFMASGSLCTLIGQALLLFMRADRK
jgi:hypothetical protein